MKSDCAWAKPSIRVTNFFSLILDLHLVSEIICPKLLK